MRVTIYQQRITQYYNRKVRIQHYKVGDLVLRLILPEARKASDSPLSPNWEGPFIIKENLENRVYHLVNMDGAILPHAWNAEYIRPYFQ